MSYSLLRDGVALGLFAGALLIYLIHLSFKVADSGFDRLECGRYISGAGLLALSLVQASASSLLLAWLIFGSGHLLGRY